jgi:hypothetical protein
LLACELLGICTTKLFVSIPQLAQRRNQTVQRAVDARHRLTLQRKKTTRLSRQFAPLPALF